MALTIETLKQMGTFHAISALHAESNPQTALEALLLEWLDSMADSIQSLEAYRDLLEEYGVAPESVERLLECHPADASTQTALLSLLNDEGVHSLDQLQDLLTQTGFVQTPACPTEVLTEGETLMAPVTITTIAIHDHSAIAETIAALAAAGQLALSIPEAVTSTVQVSLPTPLPQIETETKPTPPAKKSTPAEVKAEPAPPVAEPVEEAVPEKKAESPEQPQITAKDAEAASSKLSAQMLAGVLAAVGATSVQDVASADRAQFISYAAQATLTADAVTKLAREKGREAAVAVLTKFGAAKLPDVKPEHFAAVIAECEAVGA